jgi:hypothetical protein
VGTGAVVVIVVAVENDHTVTVWVVGRIRAVAIAAVGTPAEHIAGVTESTHEDACAQSCAGGAATRWSGTRGRTPAALKTGVTTAVRMKVAGPLTNALHTEAFACTPSLRLVAALAAAVGQKHTPFALRTLRAHARHTIPPLTLIARVTLQLQERAVVGGGRGTGCGATAGG